MKKKTCLGFVSDLYVLFLVGVSIRVLLHSREDFAQIFPHFRIAYTSFVIYWTVKSITLLQLNYSNKYLVNNNQNKLHFTVF